MKTYKVFSSPGPNPGHFPWSIVDDLGNEVAKVTYQNAARRIARLLNQDQRKVS